MAQNAVDQWGVRTHRTADRVAHPDHTFGDVAAEQRDLLLGRALASHVDPALS